MRCSNGCAGTSSTTAPTPTVRTSGARRVRCAARVVHRCASSSAADAVRCGERHLLKRLPRPPHLGGAGGKAAVYQATGLNLAEQGAWLIDTIGTERAQLVVFDSLRSLAPSIAENDGDTVLPVTATLRCIARHRPRAPPCSFCTTGRSIGPATAARASGATSKAPWRPTREEDVRHREPRRAPTHRVP